MINEKTIVIIPSPLQVLLTSHNDCSVFSQILLSWLLKSCTTLWTMTSVSPNRLTFPSQNTLNKYAVRRDMTSLQSQPESRSPVLILDIYLLVRAYHMEWILIEHHVRMSPECSVLHMEAKRKGWRGVSSISFSPYACAISQASNHSCLFFYFV